MSTKYAMNDSKVFTRVRLTKLYADAYGVANYIINIMIYE